LQHIQENENSKFLTLGIRNHRGVQWWAPAEDTSRNRMCSSAHKWQRKHFPERTRGKK